MFRFKPGLWSQSKKSEFGWSRNRSSFFKYVEAGAAFLDVLELVQDLYLFFFFLVTVTPIFG